MPFKMCNAEPAKINVNYKITICVGHVQCIEGTWIEGATAGGSRNDLERFATNPQYVLTLSEPGDLCQMLNEILDFFKNLYL